LRDGMASWLMRISCPITLNADWTHLNRPGFRGGPVV
jgi:hypothetical protein